MNSVTVCLGFQANMDLALQTRGAHRCVVFGPLDLGLVSGNAKLSGRFPKFRFLDIWLFFRSQNFVLEEVIIANRKGLIICSLLVNRFEGLGDPFVYAGQSSGPNAIVSDIVLQIISRILFQCPSAITAPNCFTYELVMPADIAPVVVGAFF